MYEYIEGNIQSKSPTQLILDCQGIGYLLHISVYTFSHMKDEGKCKVFTHLVIREDAHTLYGFSEESERDLFRALISVSGVGASTARMILSSMAPQEIRQAIIQGNAPLLQKIKGIGAKSAQRIIIDLKDKFLKPGAESSGSSALQNNTSRDQALSALLTLGFARNPSEKAVDGILIRNPDLAVEDLIKLSLRIL